MFEPKTFQLCNECGHLYARTGLAIGIPVATGRSARRMLMTPACAPGTCQITSDKDLQPITARLRVQLACRVDMTAHAHGVTRTCDAFDPADPGVITTLAELVADTVRRHAFALPVEIEPAALVAALKADLGITP